MKKTIVIFVVVLIIGISGYYMYRSQTQSSSGTSQELSQISPSRPAEITGVVVSALGNELKIAKEIGKVILSEEEQAAKKADMQKLSPEERAAAREAENATLKTEEVTLIIPVGIPVVKGSGDASGNVVSADIADLAKGVYVSIWTDASGKIEYVKIKGS